MPLPESPSTSSVRPWLCRCSSGVVARTTRRWKTSRASAWIVSTSNGSRSWICEPCAIDENTSGPSARQNASARGSAAAAGAGSNRSRSRRRASRSAGVLRPPSTASMIRTSIRSRSRSGAALRVWRSRWRASARLRHAGGGAAPPAVGESDAAGAAGVAERAGVAAVDHEEALDLARGGGRRRRTPRRESHQNGLVARQDLEVLLRRDRDQRGQRARSPRA